MTTNTLPRFIAREGLVHCFGANHSDYGKRGYCPTCLATVVKRSDNGALYDVRGRTNAADNRVEDYCCWRGTHQCDEAQVERVARERAAQIEAGELVLGASVCVVRGRKVPKGTSGTLYWLGTDVDFHGQGYVKAGLKDAEGAVHFLRLDYLEATTKVVQEDVQAPKRGSHAICSHESTPAARRACRKARRMT